MDLFEQLEWFANIDGCAVAEDVVSAVGSHVERITKGKDSVGELASTKQLVKDLGFTAKHFGGEKKAKEMKKAHEEKEALRSEANMQ